MAVAALKQSACEPRIEAIVTYKHPTTLVFEITLPRTARSVHLCFAQVPLRTTMSPTWRVTSTPLGTSISSARSYDWRTWNSWTYTSKNSRSLWYAVTTRSWNQNTWVTWHLVTLQRNRSFNGETRTVCVKIHFGNWKSGQFCENSASTENVFNCCHCCGVLSACHLRSLSFRFECYDGNVYNYWLFLYTQYIGHALSRAIANNFVGKRKRFENCFPIGDNAQPTWFRRCVNKCLRTLLPANVISRIERKSCDSHSMHSAVHRSLVLIGYVSKFTRICTL